MAEPIAKSPITQLAASNKDSLHAENLSDDVQVVAHTPIKSSKPSTKPSEPEVIDDSGNEVDVAEIPSDKALKSPINNRGGDNQRKYNPSLSKTPETIKRKLEDMNAMPYQHPGDKKLELEINANNQINSIFNTLEKTDPKAKPNAKNFSELASTIPNSIQMNKSDIVYYLFLLQQQQQQQQNQNNMNMNPNYAINAVYQPPLSEYNAQLLNLNKNGIFPQELAHYNYMVPSENGNIIYNPNGVQFYQNGSNYAGQKEEQTAEQYIRSQTNGMSIEDQRKQMQLLAATQGAGYNDSVHKQKSHHVNTISENPSPNLLRANSDMNYQNNSGAEDQNEMDSSSNIKTVRGLISKKTPPHANTNNVKKARTCFNKCCQTDSNNPNLWAKNKVNGSMICKICEDAWKKRNYCNFCYQVYMDENGDTSYNDTKSWIDCDVCKRWTHTDCEEKSMQKHINWHKDRGIESFEYVCSTCRTKTKTSMPKPVKRNGTYSNGVVGTYSTRNGVERPTDEEIEEDPITKRCKLNSENGDDKYIEINANSNTSQMLGDEPCLAKKKLDNIFNKHIQKRKCQIVQPTIYVDVYQAIDNLLSQYGKRLQLNENEVKHDLMMMRDSSKSTFSTDNRSPNEEESPDDAYTFENTEVCQVAAPEEDKKPGSRVLRARERGGGNKRGRGNNAKTFTDLHEDVAPKDDFDSEYVPAGQLTKRQTRSRRKAD